MKKLQILGRILSKQEQKEILGGEENPDVCCTTCQRDPNETFCITCSGCSETQPGTILCNGNFYSC